MSGSMGWSPGLMQWRSSLVNSANAWRTLEDCWKGCERPSADGLRPAKDGKSHAGQAGEGASRSRAAERVPPPASGCGPATAVTSHSSTAPPKVIEAMAELEGNLSIPGEKERFLKGCRDDKGPHRSRSSRAGRPYEKILLERE